MSLDSQGILAAVTLVIYLPILFLAVRIAIKYGLQNCWILLVMFSLIRIIGGALLVAAEEITPAVTGLYIGGYALEASGLSPLLLSTLSLLQQTTQTPDGQLKYGRVFRLLHLVGIGALALTIAGISISSSSGTTMRRAGVLLFAALYIILVIGTLAQWATKQQVMKYRKQLLIAISVALPFLAVRTLYSVLSAFSSSTFIVTDSTTTTSTLDGALAKFNLITGEWQIFFAMDMLMEYICVLIYVFAGLKLKLDQDYELQDHDEYPLYRPKPY
ncbi:hypothetical protein M404DRAFT_136374 [Pisolithus tinctorius Marx 270]|uniref:DUF7702 domain-containing protein n=1 Tax=Pisolithus tinctorius Marx 270 TaxID=870435 RepID=A0A0C3KCY4_PISTI|nr:hypothetical protein M404DRAFT_136374 [Pisolithus tinctorius Marx 270]